MKAICALVPGLVLGFLTLQAGSSQAEQHPSLVNQARVLAHSGEIRGVVDFCGAQGNSGTLVHIPGRQFGVKTDASGAFVIHYVPEGGYTLQIEVPGQAPVTREVRVRKKKTTQLGTIEVCPDNDNDTYPVDVDCNDNNPGIHPGAVEDCDGVDNNCDGEVDEGCVTCTDGDGDGYPAQVGCPQARDCNDSDPLIFPGGTETCNAKDDDCDDQVDEGFDADLDGYTSCEGDCDDGDASINPAALEECDEVDNDCDQITDEGFDADGDGVSSCGGDCDDADGEVFPGAVEVCDGRDNDCDGDSDEDFDFSNDPLNCGGCGNVCDFGEVCTGEICVAPAECTFGTEESCATTCGSAGVRTCSANATWGPCAPPAEECNGIDDDCDGQTDEGACAPVCGNRVLDPGEQCDDGNSNENDSCRNSCRIASCGDGILWNQVGGTEQCDDGNAIDADACTSSCRQAICGDGILWNQGGGHEVCDDGDATSGDGCSEFCAPEVDVLIVVDSSASMDEEMAAVQGNLTNFSALLGASGWDYRVILITSSEICVPAPLGSGACPLDDNGPRFRHVRVEVGSGAPLEVLLDTYSEYQGLLRAGSEKHFIAVTDDNSSLSASAFAASVSALPEFGSGYVFHSMVDTGILAGSPLQTTCGTPGTEYIFLSNVTGGVVSTLVPVTQELAGGIIIVTGCDAPGATVFFTEVAQSIGANP